MDYADADLQAELYFRTTDEMLAEFAYLGEAKAREVVIDATRRRSPPGSAADQKPFPDGSFPPIIASAADDIRRADLGRQPSRSTAGTACCRRSVRQRIEQELKSIIDNGFAVMYYIAHQLVKKSNDDGYIVGSRGSVGSSLVATLCGITEVNPLPPHYVCPACHYSEFDESGSYGSGYDLPEKTCPECGTTLTARRPGHPVRDLPRFQRRQAAGYRPEFFRRIPGARPSVHRGNVRQQPHLPGRNDRRLCRQECPGHGRANISRRKSSLPPRPRSAGCPAA